MKFLAAFLMLITFFVACDNELNVIEPKQDIPVVYGFLNLADSAQYIRVERAFVDESTSALDLAQDPEALYYDNVIVELVNGDGERYELERVDANLEGFQREDGAFAQAPNYVYKIRTEDIELKGGDEISLVITRGDSLPVIEATTQILGPTEIKSPASQNAVILDFDYVDRNRFIWQAAEGASIHDLFFNFKYRERSPETGGSFEPRSVTWRALTNFRETDERVDVELDGLSFYTFLRGAIEIDPAAERRFDELEMVVVSGGIEIDNFVSVGSANLGITSTQDVPVFTNIPGGRGIFSSINRTRLEQINLSSGTIDSLREGIYTRELNFNN